MNRGGGGAVYVFLEMRIKLAGHSAMDVGKVSVPPSQVVGLLCWTAKSDDSPDTTNSMYVKC
jgi:hypothetical protein